jgi:hypothetical protein
MLRTATFFALVFGYLCLTAFRGSDPGFGDRAFPVNSKIANFFMPAGRPVPNGYAGQDMVEADTTAQLRVLMLNYSAFDVDYANMVHRTLQRQMPLCTITDFWEGSADDLTALLTNQDAVVIAYPADGDSITLKSYARVLTQFVRQGGGVVMTGTHEFSALQQYGLFDIDSGYFCDGLEIHAGATQHPVLAGIGEYFTLHNFAYPLDISDPAFVTLADVRGYPVLGYKAIGSGKVVYLGLEYFYDEPKTARILSNTIGWLAPAKNQALSVSGQADRTVKRTEEVLFAGSGNSKPDAYDLKIYPNPYMSKATMDLELSKNAMVAADITDETGRIAGVILPRKSLSAGFYRFDLPNLASGVYFIRCQIGDKTTVKKVVKGNAP